MTTPVEKKGRIVLAGQTAMPDHVDAQSWSPVVLQHKAPADRLRMVLPVDPKQDPTPKAQQARQATQKKELAPIGSDDTLEHIASNRPFDVAQAIHTVLKRTEGQESAAQKAAVLLVGLGPELAASVLQHCQDEDTQVVVQALSELDGVTAREKDAICEDFRQLLITGDYVIRAGKSYASDVLRRAFTYHRAQVLLKQATGEPTRGFAMLEHVEPNQIVPFISKEHPQTIALILSQLDHVKAASVLNGLLPHVQENVMTRLAQMDNISPAVLQEVEDNLASELQAILSNEITQIGGPQAVAKILSHTGRSTEQHILKSLEEKYPKLAEEIENGLFVFDDIANLTDREIRELVDEIGLKDFAMALKGASEEAKARVFKVYGEEESKDIKQNMTHSGPTLVEDVEDVQLRIVRKVREFEAQGKIAIPPRARVYV